jgi:hypothetical protein
LASTAASASASVVSGSESLEPKAWSADLEFDVLRLGELLHLDRGDPKHQLDSGESTPSDEIKYDDMVPTVPIEYAKEFRRDCDIAKEFRRSIALSMEL